MICLLDYFLHLRANFTQKFTNQYEFKIDWGKTNRSTLFLINLSFSRTLQYVRGSLHRDKNIKKGHSTEIKTIVDKNDCNPQAFLP